MSGQKNNKNTEKQQAEEKESPRKLSRLRSAVLARKQGAAEQQSTKEETGSTNPSPSKDSEPEGEEEFNAMPTEGDEARLPASGHGTSQSRPFNPFKVSREVFERDPEGQQLSGVDKYMTYDEYVEYIDSDAGKQEAYDNMFAKTSVRVAQPSTMVTQVMANIPVVSLKGNALNHVACKRFQDFLDQEAMAQRSTERLPLIDQSARKTIDVAFTGLKLISKPKEWYEWDNKKFFHHLYQVFPRNNVGKGRASTEDKIRNLRLNLDFFDVSTLTDYNAEINEALGEEREGHNEKELVKLLLEGLTARPLKGGLMGPSQANKRFKEKLTSGDPITDTYGYQTRLFEVYFQLADAVVEVQKLGLVCYKNKEKFNELTVDYETMKEVGNKRRQTNGEQKGDDVPPHKVQNRLGTTSCNACGRDKVAHTFASCFGRQHPEHNPNEHIAWKDSAMGKAWKQKGRDTLDFAHLLNGKPSGLSMDVKRNASKHSGESVLCAADYKACPLPNGMIYKTIADKLTVPTLYDSGARQGNFVNQEVAAWLAARCVPEGQDVCRIPTSVANSARRIKLATTGAYHVSKGVVCFNFAYLNELTNEWEVVNCLRASVIDSEYDIIIGLPTIRKFNITAKVPSFFTESNVKTKHARATGSQCECSNGDPDLSHLCYSCEEDLLLAAFSYEDPVPLSPSVRAQLSFRQTTPIKKQMRREHMSAYMNHVSDIDDTENLDEVFPLTDDDELSDQQLLEAIHIEGPETLRNQLRALVLEFKDIHRSSVRKDPADIPPMELRIDVAKWETAVNRLPPRTQSKVKEEELKEQISKALDLNVLQPSIATEYSQVLLVPKPDEISSLDDDKGNLNTEKLIVKLFELDSQGPSNPQDPDFTNKNGKVGKERRDGKPGMKTNQGTLGMKFPVRNLGRKKKWRFCVDYVRLNDATESLETFPIPNMQHMIRRVGDKKPKFFAVMDLTSGYHQAPLSANSRRFTAFICFLGIMEWLRVPMGLKGAPSYFQRVIATVVLAGLMYIICELYIDDILVFGNSESDLVANLRKVFERFRKHKLTLNPKKCKYGISKVEYVGHIIDENGVSFSEDKREKVLSFPLPSHMKQLKKFLGLANYFRDHVRDHSVKVRPLQKMIDNYDKRQRLQWTPELEQLYFTVRDEIARCPTLFFLDPHGEIFVQTDASDYGIGVYIFQRVNEVERPTLFISKTLNATQCKWSTPEKEAYAIYYGLTHAEHLLRDVFFILQTDHRNLTFINMEGSPKIRRWKLAIQEYNFAIEYLPGERNVVADNFSRLCDIDNPDETLCTISGLRIPNMEYKLISKVHNSTVGHHGVERTLQKLVQQRQEWPHMREHVRKFIRECPCCQLMNQIRIPIRTHPFTTASYAPMECLNVDTIGPVLKDDFGNEYILVVIDCFTRFVELYPIPDVSAISAARALLQHVGRYGVAAKYRTDNGPQFANELLSELHNLLRTEHEFTVPYSKEENAIVERANKEVMRHLRAIVYDTRIKTTWSMDYLPLVMRILNAEEKTRTGVSPAELLFGNVVKLDARILFPAEITNRTSAPKRLSAHMDKMLKAQTDLIKIAHDTQLAHDEFHMSQYEPGFTEFPVNSYVLLGYPEGERPPHKLKMRMRGPFRVVNNQGSKYTIQDLITSKNMDVHVTRLRPFHYDASRTDPHDVAMHDQEEFLIEAILDHRGDRTRRQTMEFKVRWAGYDASHDSWEPYKNLRDTEQLLDYLRAKKMHSLINKKHK